MIDDTRLLVRALRHAGLARVYAMSGNQMLPVSQAAERSGPALLHQRQEAATVHMADAY